MNYKLIFLGLLLLLFTSQALAITNTNLVGYWKLDETSGTTAYDSVGTSNGVITSINVNQPGKINTAFSSSAYTSQISIDTNPELFRPTPTTPFSVCAWVYPKQNARYGYFVANKGTTGQFNWSLGYNVNYNSISFFLGKNGTANNYAESSTPLSNNTWYHVCGVSYGNNTLKLFVNGIERDSATYTQTGASATTTNMIFLSSYDSTADFYNNAAIDEVGYWSRALTDDDINDLYNSGDGFTYPFAANAIIADFDYVVDELDVDLTDTSTNYNDAVIDSWEWLIDDASVSTDQNYSFTGTEATDYNVCLIIQDTTLSLEDSDCQTISIGDITPPTTTFESFQVSGTTDQNITLTCTDNNSGCQYINFRINNGDWNYYLIGDNPLTIIYSSAGQHSISYFSTDNSDNNETTKTSNFTTYGNASFNFIDENTYAPVTTTYTINPSINGISTGSATNLDLNLQGITNQLYGFQFSAAGYGTRFYYADLNEFSAFDFNQLMLQDTNAANNITLKIYNATGEAIVAGTPVTITKANYLVGKYLTNTDGEINPFLNDLDTNYLFYVEGLYTTSQRPVLVYRPKFDSNFGDITGDWQITLTGPNSTNRYTITTNSQVIAILPNTETLYSAKICMLSGSVCNTSYFSRTYLLGFKGLVGETSIQPYLNLVADSTLRTLKVLDYATNQPYPLAKIVITSKTDLGATYIVESLYTDSTGTAGVYLTNGQTYTLTANDLTTYTIVPNAETLTYYIYFNFLVLPTETVTGIDVNTSNDFNGAEFFVMRNTLFGCSGTSDCFPSALVAIILTLIILVVATAVTVGNFIGVKGLSLIAFICFTIFFGIGWLPVYIFAFLGSITLLLLVVVQ